MGIFTGLRFEQLNSAYRAYILDMVAELANGDERIHLVFESRLKAYVPITFDAELMNENYLSDIVWFHVEQIKNGQYCLSSLTSEGVTNIANLVDEEVFELLCNPSKVRLDPKTAWLYCDLRNMGNLQEQKNLTLEQEFDIIVRNLLEGETSESELSLV